MEVGVNLSQEIKILHQDPNIRCIYIHVLSETLEVFKSSLCKGDWQTDLKDLDLSKPCFIVYRKESDFMLLHYLPMSTPVKEKMLLSISKQVLIKQLMITESIFGTTIDDFTLASIQGHLKKDHDKPLTEKEVEYNRQQVQTAQMAIGISSRGNAASISFPLEENLLNKLKELKNKQLLLITIVNEKFILNQELSLELNEVTSNIPDEPLFFVYSNQGIIFGFISPPKISIKQRMLYAASRVGLINTLERDLGFVFKNKVIYFYIV